MKIFKIVSILLTVITTVGYGQCTIGKRAFGDGETLRYSANYNWGFIWLKAGEAIFRVEKKEFEGHDVFHLWAYGYTFKSYDWIFTVREKYQSYVDPETLQPLWYERDVQEGSYKAYEVYRFRPEKKQIDTHVRKRDKPAVEGVLPLTPCLMDVMSAIYYFRSVDFSRYQPGDKIPIDMILDSKAYHLYIRYLGKETVTTRNKVKYNCLKCSIQLVEGSLFKGDEDAVVWVTDDEAKIPVMVEAEIIVGSVKAMLESVKHGSP